MPINLRDWQALDIQEARRRGKVMFRHPMGLGKMVLGSRAVKDIDGPVNLGPTLVACPNHVVPDWEDHLRREYPNDIIIVASELPPDRKREAIATPADWWIVNHHMLAMPKYKNDKGYYKMPSNVRSFIIDESHSNGLGRKARAFLGARAIADKVKNGLVLPMTGTPIKKQSDGLWAQLRLVDRTLSSYWRFVYEHCEVQETPWAVQITGSKPSMALELEARSIYHSYAEVGMTLPDVIPMDSRVRVTEATRKLYDRLKNELRDEENNPVFSAGAALAKLRTLVSKDPNMLERIQDLTEGLDSFIVFTWYHETTHLLADLLGATAITGEITGRKRTPIAKSANKIVAGIASLAASVDLSHHRNVFFYEECYEPGTQDNALARVKRWRTSPSDEPVHLKYVFADGTISAKIHNLVDGRAIDATNVTERRLIREELHS